MADGLTSANLMKNAETLPHNKSACTIRDNEYEMNNKCRGLAIIFNHLSFNDIKYEKRLGTENDVAALLECLPYLGFQKDHIIVNNDLKGKEILEYLDDFKNEKDDILKNSDCLAIFILSHGVENNRLVAYDDTYDLYDLVEQYTSNNLKQLAGKPKLFFVQACRGTTQDGGAMLQYTSSVSNGDTCGGVKLVYNLQPSMADILISHSSYHDHSSYRNESGSWYIQDFCEAIRKYRTDGLLETTGINEILTYTTFLTSGRNSVGENVNKKQCPTFNSGLLRKLCLKKSSSLLE